MTPEQFFAKAYATVHMPPSLDAKFGKVLADAAKADVNRFKIEHDGRSRNSSTCGSQARAARGRANRAPFIPVVTEMHGKGLSIGQIGKKIGRSYTFVRSVLIDAGLA